MYRGVYVHETKLPISKEEAWLFFNDINNLVRITSFPKVTIIEHNGTKTGSETKLSLNFILFKKTWKLRYVDVSEGDYFVDHSTTVPFPFKSWEHTHSFHPKGEETVMTDEIKYESYIPIFLTNIVLSIMFKGREQALQKHLPR